jgi:hypothetical protein
VINAAVRKSIISSADARSNVGGAWDVSESYRRTDIWRALLDLISQPESLSSAFQREE